MGFDLSKFRSEFLQSDGWKVSDCYKPYEDGFLRKDAQDAYEGAKWGYESRQAEIDELQKRIDEALMEAGKAHIGYKMLHDQLKSIIEILKGETKMRENFEKWAYAQKWNIFRNPKTGEYCDDFVNGAWYAYQEQQKIIDQLKQEKLDQVNKLDSIFYGEIK